MKRRYSRIGMAAGRIALLAGTSFLLTPAEAFARGAEEGHAGLDEIVVTARKREESIQNVPIAVSAYGAEMIEKRGFTNLADLNSTVPNLGWQTPPSGGTSSSAFFIRGVGQFDYIATADQSVGLYVDGVYVARSIGALLNVVDLERIEVLRGPQGTLFGRNTPAGAVQIFSKKPDLGSVNGWVEGGVGRFGRRDAKASVNLPIGPSTAIKLTGATLNQDGYGRALVTGRKLNRQRDWLLRGQFRTEPSDGVRINASLDYSRHRGTAGSLKLIGMNDADPLIGAYNSMLVAQGFQPISSADFVDGSRYDSWKNTPYTDRNTILAATGTIEYDLSDSITLKSITGYRRLRSATAEDFDGTPYPLVDQTLRTKSRQFSQELQFNGAFLDGRLTTVGGLYYFREHVDERLDNLTFAGITRTGSGPFDFAFDPTVDGLPIPVPPFSFVNNLNDVTTIDQVARSYAVFGEATFALTDALSATAGLRYTRDEKELDQSNLSRGPVSIKDHWASATPRFTLSWRPGPQFMAFATVSRGFRSGGFNGRETGAISSFKPESLWSYEAGVKTDLLDRRLRVNVTGFYYDYKDLQGTVLKPDQTVGVGNVGSVEMYGGEVELVAQPVGGLRIEANLGLLHHEIGKINTTGGIPGLLPTSRLPNAPKVTAGGAVEYAFDLGAAGSLTPRADILYKSRHEFLLPNYPGEAQRGYALINARLGWQSVDKALQVSLFGKNIFDKKYRVFGENTVGFGFELLLGTYGRPAEWGLDVKYRF